ncbi:T9SS type A sorting domain-containing protein [Adhaeribacter pallidiroseus]|uniref:Secretion system C-terminal sorting domain-containing protein n=1 Tax=Adhaeribacter pallidiroseus TaxID=2072847 RepID=A0A369QIX9_9BACT|nr:T9SS type A sorting domain-containing protein [Adhaeribacter pallidiroseus]RDC64883.1 hypothetical protein AHMF7616_03505 [Adhaeribacter pallidiroseus]
MKISSYYFWQVQNLRVTASEWRFIGIILVLYAGLATRVFAQNKLWDKTLGGASTDHLTVVQQTTDGGSIVGGFSSSGMSGDKSAASKGQHDYWIIKLKADGTKEWDKAYGGKENDELTSLQQTKDGGYILGGYSGSGKSGDKTQNSKGSYDYWLVKIDAKGNKDWDKTIGGKAYDVLVSVQQTSDGGYLLGGYSESGKSGDKSTANQGNCDEFYCSVDYWVVKLKADGTKEWDKTFGGTWDERLASLQQTPDGGYIVGGTSDSGISGNKTEACKGGNDYWIVKLKADGSKIWDKTIGGMHDDGLGALQQTPDGGYILGGSSASGIGEDKTETSKDGNVYADYWVVKLKADGSKEWDKTLGSASSDRLKSLRQTKDGGYILGGDSESETGSDKTEASKGGIDFWIVKLKPDGTKVWDKTIGSNDNDEFMSLHQTTQGDFILGGRSYAGISGDKSEPNRGASFSNDYWVVKLDNSNTNVSQYVTFAPISFQILGAVPFKLQATATSGLPITFSVVSGPATVKGHLITLTGRGTVIVKARQPGNATYQSTEATQTFVVGSAPVVKKEWDKTLGGEYSDQLIVVQQTSDGGYILGGDSNSGISGDKTAYSNGYGSFWVVKLKADGSKEWDKTFIDSNANGPEYFATVQQTKDGGYIIGRSQEDKSYSCAYEDGVPCILDYWLIKLNPDGTTAWDKVYKANGNNLLTTLQQTTDGGYILGGNSNSNQSGDKSEDRRNACSDAPYCDKDYWVIKVDADGKKEWDKTFGGDKNDELVAIKQTPDGGYILGGNSNSNQSGDKSEASKGKKCQNLYGCPSDYWIIKIRANGTKEWDKTIGGESDEALTALQQTPDGGYILGGKNNGFQVLNDYRVVRLNAQGKMEWETTIGGSGNDYLSSIQLTPDGGYLLGGSSASDAGGDKSEPSRGSSDFWLVKIKANGTKEWDKIFGGDDADHLAVIQNTQDGGYILGGTSNSNQSNDKSEAGKGQEDYWIVKISEEQLLTAQWNRRYGGKSTDNFTAMIRTKDGGYLAGGYTNSGLSGDKTQPGREKNDYWIVKTDKNGQKLWDKRYGGSNHDYLNHVIQTQDGGYLLAGSSLSEKSGDKSAGSRGDRDYWIVKTNAQGNIEWDKTFGGSGYDELKKVAQLSTGQYLLGGYSRSPQSGDKSESSQGGTDYWVVKLSYTGTKLWDKRYGGAQDEILGSFSVLPDGGLLLGGSSRSGVSGDKTQPSQGGSDFWLVRLDIRGNKIWDKRFGGAGDEELYSMGLNQFESEQATYAGDYFVGGTSTSGIGGNKTQARQGGKDFWLVQLHRNGNLVRDLTYGGDQDEELRSVIQTSNGDYLLAGTSSSGQSGDISQASKGQGDYWIVHSDAFGNKYYDQRYGGSGTEELRYLQRTPDGGFVLGGRSDSGVSGDRTQPSQGGTDYWLVKVAPHTSPAVASREANLVEEPVAELTTVKAYPNPFQDKVIVIFTLPETQAATVRVLDSQGREINTLFQQEAKANQTYQVEWQAGKQASGMYLLQLQTPTEQNTQKLLLTR